MNLEDAHLTVYIMGEDDVHIGLTGRDEAPIAIVIPKTGLGLGLPIPVAEAVHNALCNALAMLESMQESKREVPKQLLN